MATYCILGGGGSFAIHCALYLLDRADKVVGIGRNPLRPEPFTLGIEKRENYEYRTYHIVSEHDMLMEYLDELKPDIIINFAAQGEGAVSWKHSWRFFDTNGTALVRLYEALSERSYLKRFIHIGTSEIYGSVQTAVDEDAPLNPTTPYAASKGAFDLYLLAMQKAGKGAMNILRPSNCYCPGQLLHRIIPKTIIAGLSGKKVPLHGGGQAKKSYLHARDLARAIYLVSEKAPIGKLYNVGPDNSTSISEVCHCCADALGMSFESLFEEVGERFAQDAQYWLDSSAFKNDTGWKQEIGWTEGLGEMVDWGLKYLPQLRDWPTGYVLRA